MVGRRLDVYSIGSRKARSDENKSRANEVVASGLGKDLEGGTTASCCWRCSVFGGGDDGGGGGGGGIPSGIDVVVCRRVGCGRGDGVVTLLDDNNIILAVCSILRSRDRNKTRCQ